MRWVALGMATVSWLWGCSSSTSTSSTCGKVAACGGNVVGIWKIVEACASVSNYAPSACPNLTEQPLLSASGTFTFNADGSYAISSTSSGSIQVGVPESCLGGSTCDRLAGALSSALQADAGVTSTRCAASGSGCGCTLDLGTNTTNESGTYAVSGTTLTTTSAGGTGSGDFCVQGNALHMIDNAMSMNLGPMGQVSANGDIVAVKQ